MQTLGNSRSIDEVARTKVAHNVLVQVLDLQLDLLLSTSTRRFTDDHRGQTLPFSLNRIQITSKVLNVEYKLQKIEEERARDSFWTLLYFVLLSPS